VSYSVQINLEPIKRTDHRMMQNMKRHYSQPKGFVGRNICYAITVDGICYGTIAGGSATRFLPGRRVIDSLNNGINNIFFHIERVEEHYPCRQFSVRVLAAYRHSIERDWLNKYGDIPLWHETLVELPRKGECYIRDKWVQTGTTKGYTCKRIAGKGTDSWTGKRVWDVKNLRPKLVFTHNTEDK